MKLTEDSEECHVPVETIFGSSLAKNLNFEIGDLIHSINGIRIKSRMDVYEILEAKNISEISILRDSQLIRVNVNI